MVILKEIKVIRSLIKYDNWNELTFDMKYHLHKGARVVFVNKKHFLVMYESKSVLKMNDKERGDMNVSTANS